MKWKIALLLLIIGVVSAPQAILTIWGYKKTSEMMSQIREDEKLTRESRFGADVEPGKGTLDGDLQVDRLSFPDIDRTAWSTPNKRKISQSDEELEKIEMTELFDGDLLNRQRSIRMTKHVTEDEVFLNGSITEDPDTFALVLRARAPELLHKNCNLFLGSIAKTCAVRDASIRMESGGFEVSGTLNYVPNYAMGTAEYKRGHDIVVARSLNLWPQASKPDELPADNQAGHDELIKRAIDLCDEVIAEYGNCVIQNLRISRQVINSTWEDGARFRVADYAINASMSVASFIPFQPGAADAYVTKVQTMAE